MTDLDHASSALAKLWELGRARNRDVDHEPRTVTLTDDEALAVCRLVEHLQGAPLEGRGYEHYRSDPKTGRLYLETPAGWVDLGPLAPPRRGSALDSIKRAGSDP